MLLGSFLFLYSLQAGCTFISGILITLGVIIALVNHNMTNELQGEKVIVYVIAAWVILLAFTAVFAFASAYFALRIGVFITVILYLITIIIWFVLSVCTMTTNNLYWLQRTCVHGRCPDTLWLMETRWGVKLNFTSPYFRFKRQVYAGDNFRSYQYDRIMKGNKVVLLNIPRNVEVLNSSKVEEKYGVIWGWTSVHQTWAMVLFLINIVFFSYCLLVFVSYFEELITKKRSQRDKIARKEKKLKKRKTPKRVKKERQTRKKGKSKTPKRKTSTKSPKTKRKTPKLKKSKTPSKGTKKIDKKPKRSRTISISTVGSRRSQSRSRTPFTNSTPHSTVTSTYSDYSAV